MGAVELGGGRRRDASSLGRKQESTSGAPACTAQPGITRAAVCRQVPCVRLPRSVFSNRSRSLSLLLSLLLSRSPSLALSLNGDTRKASNHVNGDLEMPIFCLFPCKPPSVVFNQEIHIYFVINCQACGWILEPVSGGRFPARGGGAAGCGSGRQAP